MAKSSENVLTRKVQLIPEISDRKEYTKRLTKYINDSYSEKIEKKRNKKFNRKDYDSLEKFKEAKEKNESEIQNLQNALADLTAGTITKKMVDDYTYGLVREAMESESSRKNYILSHVYSQLITSDYANMDKEGRKQFFKDIWNPCCRKKGSNLGSIFDNTNIDNILGGYGTGFSQDLKSKINNAIKDGLLEGKVSLPMYKKDSPFSIASKFFNFYHTYESFDELEKNIEKSNCQLFMAFGGNGNPTIANFRVNLGCGSGGKKRKDNSICQTMLKVLAGEYKICGSSIQISKGKIMLNLSMDIPIKEHKLDPDICLGVDVGYVIPAMCGLNKGKLAFRDARFGDGADLNGRRKRIREQKKRMQVGIATNKGGHGRAKKIKALDRFREKEKNFAQTYNHKVSHDIVNLALKNNAMYINLENLKGITSDEKKKRELGDWSYFQLQEFITYKAKQHGIIVRKVNPYRTSQTCSCCGHWEEGQRVDRDTFICKNPECKWFGKKIHADLNAAINIAKSTDFSVKKDA